MSTIVQTLIRVGHLQIIYNYLFKVFRNADSSFLDAFFSFKGH